MCAGKEIIVLGNALSAMMMLEAKLAAGELPEGVPPCEVEELLEFLESVRAEMVAEYAVMIDIADATKVN